MTRVHGESEGDVPARIVVLCGIVGWLFADLAGLMIASLFAFVVACTKTRE